MGAGAELVNYVPPAIRQAAQSMELQGCADYSMGMPSQSQAGTCAEGLAVFPLPLVGEGEGEREFASTVIAPILTFPRQGGRDSWLDFAIVLAACPIRLALPKTIWYLYFTSPAFAHAFPNPVAWESPVVTFAPSEESLGNLRSTVEAALLDLDSREVVPRIWQGDHRVWNEEPTEISDRLGWLELPATMRPRLASLAAFADQVRSAGFQHVALLGMGGSSLGPEVLRQTFGSRPGYPRLIVLDSTLPAWVEAVDARIDPASTLFLVSSKSGTTIEPNTLYSYYRRKVDAAVGEERAGSNFVAITDPGTPLQALAERENFRRVFANPPEIGGRYSVLSCFGLAPAALAGLDLQALLGSAKSMRDACTAQPAGDNPGARLGAVMAALATEGRDKLTLVASPSLSGFGLWAEQLLAESLGKTGRGIIPVAQEPLLPPHRYATDRLFVYLRLEGDDNSSLDALVNDLSPDHPVVRLNLKDTYDLGGEFYRWEFATAVAGNILGVHPFDQPDVQGAKDMTDRVLADFVSSGSLPAVESEKPLAALLGKASPGDYLAVLAYLPDSPAVVKSLEGFRRRVSEGYGIATTAGFGPRYLHSTGQLHKGGPGSGIFLLLTADHGAGANTVSTEIPGRPYSFATLADAQATGDFLALRSLQRRVVRVHLAGSPGKAIEELTNSL